MYWPERLRVRDEADGQFYRNGVLVQNIDPGEIFLWRNEDGELRGSSLNFPSGGGDLNLVLTLVEENENAYLVVVSGLEKLRPWEGAVEWYAGNTCPFSIEDHPIFEKIEAVY